MEIPLVLVARCTSSTIAVSESPPIIESKPPHVRNQFWYVRADTSRVDCARMHDRPKLGWPLNTVLRR